MKQLHCAFLRAAELQHALDAYASKKITEHTQRENSRRQWAENRRQQFQPDTPRRYIAAGGLTTYDWTVITEYIKLLEPLKEATKLLEGRGNAGLHGAIWEIIPTFDWLLTELEQHKERLVHASTASYPDQDPMEDHLVINVNAAWSKLNEYFTKLDATPVYYAATVLNPATKNFCASAWQDRPEVLRKSDRMFTELWASYKARSRPVTPPAPATAPAPIVSQSFSSREQHLLTHSAARPRGDAVDEYDAWKNVPPLSHSHPLYKRPIEWWLLHQTEYPCLSKLALDILTIPASSTECERGFSETGDMLESRRSNMLPAMVQALQCTRSWKRQGFKPVSKLTVNLLHF